jgi:hypothetical protein
MICSKVQIQNIQTPPSKTKKAATGFYFFCDSHKRNLFIFATFEDNTCNQEKPTG